tara:strand:- start:522 stop:1142 length:621 start_codon:yes stop_codon:yes gene_type:complete
MDDTLVFFVPIDVRYDFNDVVDELSCTYCTINDWNIHSQDENGWWYTVNINWDMESSDAVVNLQKSLFMNNAYIYVGHKVSKNKTVYHDVNIFAPRIYEYPNLYKQYMELLESYSQLNTELNHIKETNTALECESLELKNKIEKMIKEEKNKCEQIEYYKLKTAKFDIKSKKYKESKQQIRKMENELTLLHQRNQELFERYPQHCC